ncbi:hypothetical protein D9619_006958 [Psilocybe cf. subviscida]|uniref:HAT C-terminal dimerisation domain-containing protein n=1 Tax=Psilocybe cf. subviscida TaxID=2480587 RepID=A0A8H5B2B6_9AGAR|nr:hypothetical protein D9619_006958 [Psilocybe cf. subviscida]
MAPRQFPPARPPSPAETFEEPSPSESDDDAPPIILSPIKRRNARGPNSASIKKLSDIDVWRYSDAEIIDAAMDSWRSPVYDHYNISLRRDTTATGHPMSLVFVFECKFNQQDHPTLTRLRNKTSEGTDTTNTLPSGQYTYATHRALIALRCAKNFRPFNMVTDSDYILEVLLLRPGTKIPDPSTVSRDIKHIYEQMALHVKNYFLNIDGPVHLVLDGWTSPLIFAYLGLVIIWYADGNIHRTILEFIRLKSNHDGRYLAKVVADCLERFQLGNRLFSICMDNATNCDKLAEVFLSFFFKKPRSRKRVGISKGEASAEYGRPGESRDELGNEDEVVLDDGDVIDLHEDEAVLEEAEVDAEDDEEDEGQVVHNEKVAKTLKEKAIRLMAQKDIVIDPKEETIAQQIFPRVAGLARRVHDSPTTNEKFQELITNSYDPDTRGGPRSLTRRVPTRWNSDLACLESHMYFRDIIEELTSIRSLKLAPYTLSAEQWEIASDVHQVLLLFKGTTELFSKSQVPLIVDVIPMLEQIREGLIGARDDKDNEVPNVVRVACQAGILLVDKYSTFTADCPVYPISIVLCPDRKLKWFKDHGRTVRQIKEIEKLVISTWKSDYEGGSNNAATRQAALPRITRSRYEPTAATERFPVDSIQHYLKDSLASASDILAAGGYIKYWTNLKATRPRLAKMALDYCSAPASSVDAERAFSSGRRQVNFMQHNMSSQTFKAQMAVGSWANSPLYPGLDTITNMISKQVIADEGENPFIVPSNTSARMSN